MKSNSLTLMAALLGPVLLLVDVAAAAPGQEDLTKVYEAGRAAFNKGDLVKAKAAFIKVLRAKPDFDLAQIYMAQIKHAEALWEARPRSQKIAEQARATAVDLESVTLGDALEVVRRELEKAGGGAKAGTIELLTDLPEDHLARPVSLSVRNQAMRHFIDSVAFAGDVGIAFHPRGISVTASAGRPDKLDPATSAAIKAMKENAQSQVIPLIRFNNISVDEAVQWLRSKADPVKGPQIVLRGPANPAKINFELRHSSISDALRSIAIVADLDVSWHPWGAGLAPKAVVAVNTPAP